MKYKYALFDLDGTLTDPYKGITKSVKYALEKLGFPIPEEKEMKRYIGPPLYFSFTHFDKMSDAQAHEAIIKYRERFETVGLYENSLLDGCRDCLEKIRSAGIILAVATSKPENMAVRILEHFRIAEYFAFIGGATRTLERSTKSEVIEYVLNTLEITKKHEAVMIGDRSHDIEGAKENELDSIGLLCGYGDREELNAAGADYIFDALEDLTEFLTAE